MRNPPASSRSLGRLQARKRLEVPLNQPSQYFSDFDKSMRHLYTLCRVQAAIRVISISKMFTSGSSDQWCSYLRGCMFFLVNVSLIVELFVALNYYIGDWAGLLQRVSLIHLTSDERELASYVTTAGCTMLITTLHMAYWTK